MEEIKTILKKHLRNKVSEQTLIKLEEDLNSKEQENLMTLEQLASYLQISKSTIYKKTSTLSIPTIKLGSKLLFRKSSIDKWLSQQTFFAQDLN